MPVMTKKDKISMERNPEIINALLDEAKVLLSVVNVVMVTMMITLVHKQLDKHYLKNYKIEITGTTKPSSI